MNKLKELLSKCKASVSITVNQHRDYYSSVKDYIEEQELIYEGLIDEIGSEFDEKRFNFFYNFITGLNTQCFITANNKNILKKIKINSSIFSIINGDCKKIS